MQRDEKTLQNVDFVGFVFLVSLIGEPLSGK